MKRMGFSVLSVALGVIAFAAGSRIAATADDCYTITPAGPGCGECTATSCGSCIEGTPNYCATATYTHCPVQQTATVSQTGKKPLKTRTVACSQLWNCAPVAPCGGYNCQGGSWNDDVPGGTFEQTYVGPDACFGPPA